MDLEAQLVAAGYILTGDPDSVMEEEWRENHGIMKLELLRMGRCIPGMPPFFFFPNHNSP